MSGQDNNRTDQAWDVIVVGATVAGAATAMLLARAGLRVLCLDRSRHVGDTVSTHALHSLLVRELERELPKEVPVRSEVGELSERSPSALLEELARRGALQS